ncbi:restriction endonuclease subunit S [Bacillus sp. FJAT-45037]|uniref:restriction endonuclease subunit S n=1 Tax=Bacillus sp. FJAT-45037 TaxID=2011007 RepID=UPI000C24B11D|nr:restriction endonuclease subunit S [Bacillus sp. FJAT-45037]
MVKKKKTMEELLEEALVPEETQPYHVPKNWVWVRFASLVKESKLGLVRSSKQQSDINPYSYLKMNNITTDGQLDLCSLVRVNAEDKEISVYELRDGDFLFNTRNSIELVGKSTIYSKTIEDPVLFNNNILRVRFLKHFTPEIINYYFISPHGKKSLSDVKSGTTSVAAIYAKNLNTVPIPIPPIHEQKRIAEKVERLLSKVDEAKQLIEEAKESFELRRAAILDKAFRGELTRETGLQNRSKSGDVYSIPNDWEWKLFKEIAKVKSNLVKPYDYLNHPLIAPDNIGKGNGQLIGYQTVQEANVKSAKHLFYKGQILYSKIRPYLSKVTIAEFDGLCSADMYPIETDINNDYLFWYMLSPFFVEKASTAGSRSVLPKINQKELGEIPVPVASKNSQQKVVEKIEKALLKEKIMLESLGGAYRQIEMLQQSILSKAFKGELGTNDPSEENAIELLKEVLQQQVK